MDLHQILTALDLRTQGDLAAAMDPPLNQSAISHWKKRGIGDAIKRRLERLAIARGVEVSSLGLDQ